MSNTTIKPPTWFWVVVGLGLLWNLVGVFNYLDQVMMSPEVMAAKPEDERVLMEGRPAWASAAFAFAVWGGVVGCIGLLLRKAWATIALMVSLVGIVVQMSYGLFATPSLEILGAMAIVFPAILVLIGAGLIYLSRHAQSRAWIT